MRRCRERGLGGQALQWVWLVLWQRGPGLGLQGVAGTGRASHSNLGVWEDPGGGGDWAGAGGGQAGALYFAGEADRTLQDADQNRRLKTRGG